MRERLKSFLLLALAALFFTGCATLGAGAAGGHKVHHVVIFWLKEPGNAGARAKLISASREFAYIPGVLSVSAGPVLPGDRPMVDSSFDVAVVMTFRDKHSLDAYLARPEHQKAVKELVRPLVKKMAVYDFSD